MNKNDYIFKTLSSYKKELEREGYDVVYIGLYGSQNYNVDDEESDIDARAIVIPSLHDIIFRKTTSKVVEFETGAVDVKDLITYYDVIKKGNFSFIEAIDTPYFIGDKKIKELFQQIRPNLKSMLGAMYEKRKALTHEYPSKHKEFEKWGFDPKQYHHIIRLKFILQKNNNELDKNFISYIKYDDESETRKYLISQKRNYDNLLRDFVEQDSDRIIEEAKFLIPKDYNYQHTNIDDEVFAYLEKEMKKKLFNLSPCKYAREYRTFDLNIPKKDLEKFEELQKYQGKDISYIVYEILEML